MKTINVLLLVDGPDAQSTQAKLSAAQVPVGRVVLVQTLAGAKPVLTGPPPAIDVVLLELELEDSHGLDTLKAVRAIFSGVVIVLTQRGDEQGGIEAIKLGADDYLLKGNTTPERLRTTLAHAMTRHDARYVGTVAAQKLDRLEELVTGK